MRPSTSHHLSWARAAALVALVAGAALGAALASGCGSATSGDTGGGPAASAASMTAQEIFTKATAAGQKTTSAQIAFKATVDITPAPGPSASADLGPLASGPATVSGTAAVAISPLAMDLSAKLATAGDGATMSVGMRIVGGRGWVNALGQWYAMPPDFEKSFKEAEAQQAKQTDPQALFKTAGVDPSKWASTLTVVGIEHVDGVPAYHIHAVFDAKQFVADLAKMMANPETAKLLGTQAAHAGQDMPTAADLKDVEKVIKEASGDIWYATGTFELVKLTAKGSFAAPSAAEIAASGVESVTVDLEMTQTGINKPVKVQAPTGALPWEQGPFGDFTTGSSSSDAPASLDMSSADATLVDQ